MQLIKSVNRFEVAMNGEVLELVQPIFFSPKFCDNLWINRKLYSEIDESAIFSENFLF